jgi:allophanate hydrolase
LGTFTNFANLCDMAAFAVPIGRPAIGGVLLGPAWSEGRLAPLADLLHRQFAKTVGGTTQRLPPPGEPNPLEANETALFCIGAHMSGLPLNGQLTAVGGRFLRETQTQPVYRLLALGNRPAMIRAADGAAINGEVWALPTAAIGVLLAQVPPPLGFGTVTLDDGPCLGFLAESAGVLDATDITHLGGWRAWLRSNLRD